MSSYLPRSLRSLTIGELYQIPDNPPKCLLGTYSDREDLIRVTSGGFTIVLCREIRKNIKVAVSVAVGLAHKYPDKKILLLNSYAGTELLKSAFSKEMWRHRKDDRSMFEAAARKDAENGVAMDTLPNIRLLDVPMGEWSTEQVRQEVTEHGAEIIIWDSFEFSAVNRYRREIVAREMLKLREEYNLTVVVFSHEMKRDVKAGIPSRGAIGMISAYADSVWRLETEEEMMKPIKQYRTPTIHEQKTQKNEVDALQKQVTDLEIKEDDDWEWDPAKEEEEWERGWSPYLASNFAGKSEEI
jgi:hypothetical protein